jgi:hypothetical protein
MSITAASLITFFSVMRHTGVDILSDGLDIAVLLGLLGSIAFFCLSVVVECCGQRISRAILGAGFVIFTAWFLAVGILFLVDRDAILDQAARLWINHRFFKSAPATEQLFNCSCWNISCCLVNETAPPYANLTCHYRLREVLRPYWTPIAVTCLCLCGLTLSGAVIAFLWAKSYNESEYPKLLSGTKYTSSLLNA